MMTIREYARPATLEEAWPVSYTHLMLILALVLAQLLNSPDLKGKGIYRTMIFLPCATSLVSYSMIFKSLFANDGLVNRVLSTVGIPTVDWFQNAWAARWVIVIALVWRWTGYNLSLIHILSQTGIRSDCADCDKRVFIRANDE